MPRRDLFFRRTAFPEEQNMKIYEELQSRGLIAQVTDEAEIRELINNGGARFYIGFDPTADSLHVGHFMALCLMKRLQMAGNKPVVLLGGGTGFIGDPSGRTDMRAMMDADTIRHNCDCFLKQIGKFIEFGEDKAIVVNNADWLLDLKYIDLLREVGACFSVNNMLRAECYKQRMERGLSFFEFNYMIMQSYDFWYLNEHYGCNMQFGGDDQWSNMLAGTELIRKKSGKDAYAMTITLLLNSEGKKMGKTAKGAVWLDPEKTAPFDFYQYWRNVDDADVMKCIKMLTFIPLDEIADMETWPDSRINEKKEILAYALTTLVHGEEEAKKAQTTSKALFSGGEDDSLMPTTEVPAGSLVEGETGVIDLLVLSGIAKSRGEARRLIEQGGITLDGEAVTDFGKKVTAEQLKNGIKIRKGKKTHRKFILV
jgi:tyrosyl-tRNA synthetase